MNVKFLTQINDIPDLTIAKANAKIKEEFPNFDSARTKNYFRALVKEHVAKVPLKDLEKVLILLNQIYPKLTPNLRTLDSVYSSDVRRQFKNNSKKLQLSKKLLKISYQDKGQLIQEDKERNESNESNRLEFRDKEIFQIIEENIHDTDPIRRLLALIFVSGSRPVELVDKSSYKVDPANPDHWILQSEIAKKKGKDHEEVRKPILVISAQQFVDAVDKLRVDLRAKYSELINKDSQLSSKISSPLNAIAKKVFNNKPGTTPYSGRKIYGAMSYTLYGKSGIYGDNPTLARWISNVLGHSKGSISSANNYSTVEVKNNEPFNEHSISTKVSELEIGLDSLEERFQDATIPNVPKAIDENRIKTSKTALEKVQFAKLNKVFDDYVKNSHKKPTQKWLESNQNGVIPRSVVRRFYAKKLIEIIN